MSNIAFIDRDKVLHSMPQAQPIREEGEAILKEKYDQFQQAAAQYQREAPGMIDAVRADTEQKLHEMNEYIQRLQKELGDQIEAKLSGIINDVVTQIAQRKNYDMVVDKKSVCFGGSNLDITEEVLSILN